ncbi:MAG: hypothetical protein ACFFDH_15310 [Promethearchaeota archaeon]
MLRKDNIINDENAQKIANNLLKKGIKVFGDSRKLYIYIQRAAVDLGIIKNDNTIDLGLALILSEEDYLKVSDKIWEFLLKGYIAPGINQYNSWFPFTHITEKGKDYLSSLEK